ncbi:MAG: hypothetical protein AAF627_10380 [Myxococcota bacterium]
MPGSVNPIIPTAKSADMAAIQSLSPANDGTGWGWNDGGVTKAFGLVEGTSVGTPRFAFDTKANLLAGKVAPIYAEDQTTANDMASYTAYNETNGRLTIGGLEYEMVLNFDGSVYRVKLERV